MIINLSRKKSPTNIREVKNLTYLNKPIPDEEWDGIGISPYVDNLESAIRNGASLIAVVSQFGTGKSSIMELLKKRYHGKETIDGIRYTREYHEVNMWSVLKDGQADAGTELHKSFLYQLISAVDSTKGEYVSKRMSTNYGLFRLSLDSFGKTCIGVGAVILWLVGLLLKLAQSVIVKWELMGEKTAEALPIILMMIAFAMLTYVALRSEMVFSTKESEKRERLIDENELIQLYRNYILQPIRGKLRLKSRHYVVFIEDLDRSNHKDKIYNFLKELRKYYIADDVSRKYRNRLTFVVNIMPESLLQDHGGFTSDDGLIYDKIFDYMISLNRVNIDNYDSVLDKLILEKRHELEDIGISVSDSNNVHSIPGMQWIIHGHDVSIRQIKARLNEAILIYHSIHEKFDIPYGKSYADFSRCAMVAYLRSEYSEDFYRMKDEDVKVLYEDFVTTVYQTKDEATEAWHENCENLSMNFIREIYELMEKHLIDGNYRIYFNNYPNKSHLYTVDEEWVRDIIIFDEYETFSGMEGELLKDNDDRVSMVMRENAEAVEQALNDYYERMTILPNVAWISVTLWNHCVEHRKEELIDTLTRFFKDLQAVNDTCRFLFHSLMDRKQGVEVLADVFRDNNDDDNEFFYAVRQELVSLYDNRVQDLKSLFAIVNKPVTWEELTEMEGIPIEDVMELFQEVDPLTGQEVLQEVCRRMLSEFKPGELNKYEKFFEEATVLHPSEEFDELLMQYEKVTKTYHSPIISYLWKRVEDGFVTEANMISVMNEIPAEQMSVEDLSKLDELENVADMDTGLLEKMRQQRRLFAYTRLLLKDGNCTIDFTEEEIQSIVNERLKWFLENRPEMFYRFRLWLCESRKNDILQYKEVFFSPYPEVIEDEIRNVTSLDIALELFDVARWNESTSEIFAWYCNRKFRTSNEAFKIFYFMGRLRDADIESIFSQFDLHKVKFSGMSVRKKDIIVEILHNPLELDEPMKNIEFQRNVGCLVPTLERELQEAMNDGTIQSKEVEKAYVGLVNGMEALSKATYGILSKMNTIYGYNDTVTNQFWEHKKYRFYVVSKILWKGSFEIEHDKLDKLWDTYVGLLKTGDGFKNIRTIMYRNQGFLQMLMERQVYQELPEEGMLALAGVLQNPDVMKFVVENYSSDVVITYFSQINGFEDKTAAKAFVELMKKYPKYAQVSAIYDNAHDKLIDGKLKGVYTKIYRHGKS